MLIHDKTLGTVAYMGGVAAVLEDFCWAWSELREFNQANCGRGKRIHHTRTKASFHAWARNQLAANMEGDWLLMLDTDHTFEPDLCMRMVRLMDTKGLRILTALYQYKGYPYPPVLFGGTPGERKQIIDWSDGITAFAVASAGAGSLLVRRDVFQEIFDKTKEQPFDSIPPIGEDHSFFSRAGRCGIQAWCCPAIESHHLEIRPVTLDLYNRPGMAERGQAVEALA